MQYFGSFLMESIGITKALDPAHLERVVGALCELRNREGRLFFIGSGGGAGHSSHACADFRKLAGIESYSVTDNVSELTARINDDSWEESYLDYLRASRFRGKDGIFVFSVGGGSSDPPVSGNLVRAIEFASELNADIFGIVGRDGGFAGASSDLVIKVPQPADGSQITTQTEGFQALIWHMLIGHPLLLDKRIPKWEGITQ